MIKEIHIAGLRGILDGGLDGLGPLTILLGPNGCGKSTVLDALVIGAGNHPGDSIGRAVRRRPYSWNGARWLFARQNEERTASIGVRRVNRGKEEERSTILSYQGQPRPELANALSQHRRPEPYCAVIGEITHPMGKAEADVGFAADNWYWTFPLIGEPIRGWEMRLVDAPQGANQALDEVYTMAVERGRKESAVEALRSTLGDEVKDITLLTDNRIPVVHIVYADGSVPVSVAGEGVAGLVRIALELGGRPGGTILLEEPETHQHPRLIWQTAEVIWETVKRGVQVIATTHSLDLIDGLLAKAPGAQLDQLAVFRLKLAKGELRHTRIAGDDALSMRTTFEDDLR